MFLSALVLPSGGAAAGSPSPRPTSGRFACRQSPRHSSGCATVPVPRPWTNSYACPRSPRPFGKNAAEPSPRPASGSLACTRSARSSNGRACAQSPRASSSRTVVCSTIAPCTVGNSSFGCDPREALNTSIGVVGNMSTGPPWSCAKMPDGSSSSISTAATLGVRGAPQPFSSETSLRSDLTSRRPSLLGGSLHPAHILPQQLDLGRSCQPPLVTMSSTWHATYSASEPNSDAVADGGLQGNGIFTAASLRPLDTFDLASNCLRCVQMGARCPQCVASRSQAPSPITRRISSHSAAAQPGPAKGFATCAPGPASARVVSAGVRLCSPVRARRASSASRVPQWSPAAAAEDDLEELEAIYADALERSQGMWRQAEESLAQERQQQALERVAWERERLSLLSELCARRGEKWPPEQEPPNQPTVRSRCRSWAPVPSTASRQHADSCDDPHELQAGKSHDDCGARWPPESYPNHLPTVACATACSNVSPLTARVEVRSHSDRHAPTASGREDSLESPTLTPRAPSTSRGKSPSTEDGCSVVVVLDCEAQAPRSRC